MVNVRWLNHHVYLDIYCFFWGRMFSAGNCMWHKDLLIFFIPRCYLCLLFPFFQFFPFHTSDQQDRLFSVIHKSVYILISGHFSIHEIDDQMHFPKHWHLGQLSLLLSDLHPWAGYTAVGLNFWLTATLEQKNFMNQPCFFSTSGNHELRERS